MGTGGWFAHVFEKEILKVYLT